MRQGWTTLPLSGGGLPNLAGVQSCLSGSSPKDDQTSWSQARVAGGERSRFRKRSNLTPPSSSVQPNCETLFEIGVIMRSPSAKGDVLVRVEATNQAVDCRWRKRWQLYVARLRRWVGGKGKELGRGWGAVARSKEEESTKARGNREKSEENKAKWKHCAHVKKSAVFTDNR